MLNHAASLLFEHYAVFNDRDLDAFAATLHEDVEMSSDGPNVVGRDAVLGCVQDLLEAFPDLRIEIVRIIAQADDLVVAEIAIAGTKASRASTNGAEQHEIPVVSVQTAALRDGRFLRLHSGGIEATGRAGPDDLVTTSGAMHERYSLRRIAGLIAQGADNTAIFAAVNEEVARLSGADRTSLVRFEADQTITVLASLGMDGEASMSTAPNATDGGGVRVPITVDGRVWGMAFAGALDDRELPDDTVSRIAGFTQLLGSAIATTEVRARLERLADEQAALRRIAELIAHGAEPEAVFATVVREAFELLEFGFTALVRLNGDGSTTIVALHNGRGVLAVGDRRREPGDGVIRKVLRTAQPARSDDYSSTTGGYVAQGRSLGLRSGAGAPVLVEGRVWGVIVGLAEEALPPAIEHRLAQFAEPVGTAIFAAQARAAQRGLAEEQTALRNVAELVARGVAPDEVFASVADEASRLLGDQETVLLRFEDDGAATVVAQRGGSVAPGRRVPLVAGTLATRVRRTARPARIDDHDGVPGSDAENGRGGAVAAPITVDGRIWGMLSASSAELAFPGGTEHRLSQFAELVAAAIANAESRAQLRASRARVVATADDARRRIQRDVHDGAQQQLAMTVLTLKTMLRELADDDPQRELLDEALAHAERANVELRNTVRGILPTALTHGGLRAGVASLVAHLPLPVEVAISVPRLAPAIETTAYFVIAEALTNVVKHAGAELAHVSADVAGGALRVEVRDDGAGGVDAARGTGITGLFDRVAAADGSIVIESPPGAGTRLAVTLPLPDEAR